MLSPPFKTVVFHGDNFLGEADVFPQNPTLLLHLYKEIRITSLSPPSDRCPPLAVLHTISPYGLSFKLEPKSPSDQSPTITALHAACLREFKTAVFSLGGEEEVHLVAMPSKSGAVGCFWGFPVARRLYASCLGLLNPRCLAIVFDLDETLIVANTLRSFDDKIDALERRLSNEEDPARTAGMAAEMRRYVDDRTLLKQYADSDFVVDNGKIIKVQLEQFPAVSNTKEPVVRPVIRLPERNTVLTRINPEVRDTSVLVKLRPAWDEFRSYLTAKGRKRFEVYVCTMSERDYALEMWRLLDPESHLITSAQLLERVVCVKPGSKKCLANVFQDSVCHPKMAMVIDDRLKVWDDKDQPRVHVVPAFAPYYAPQAELANPVPILWVARNVACNVRGGFFKTFDERLLPRISEMFYEDLLVDLPLAPDTSNIMMLEEQGIAQGANLRIAEGGPDVDDERKICQLDDRPEAEVPIAGAAPVPGLRLQTSSNPVFPSTSLLPTVSRAMLSTCGFEVPSTSGREERDLSGLQPDPKRRLLQPQHVNDSCPRGSSDHASCSPVVNLSNGKSHCGLLKEDTTGFHSEGHVRGPQFRRHAGGDFPNSDASPAMGVDLTSAIASAVAVEVLHEIGQKCSSQVIYRYTTNTNNEVPYIAEVSLSGEKVGDGNGRSSEEAQIAAAVNALQSLAGRYRSYMRDIAANARSEAERLMRRDSARKALLNGGQVLPAACTVDQLPNARLPVVFPSNKSLPNAKLGSAVQNFNDKPPTPAGLCSGEINTQALEEAPATLKSTQNMVQKQLVSSRFPLGFSARSSTEENLQGILGILPVPRDKTGKPF